jgi:hypothetical protein
MGQIIDFRAMINEATKLNADENGAGNNSVIHLLVGILVQNEYL